MSWMPGSVGIAALQNGELDFMGAIGSAERAALRGLPLRVVLVASTSPDFLLLGVPGITSMEQLRGKVIAGDRSPQANASVILAEMLRRAGIDSSQYETLAV